MPNLDISKHNIDHMLHIYSDLHDNWDNQGAVAPSHVTLSNSTNFWHLVQQFQIELPAMYLSKDGEVNFIWSSTNTSVYIDISFNENGFYCYAKDAEGREVMSEKEGYDERELKCILNLLMYQNTQSK
ncbi:hypothetical protein OQJ13_12420 [Legionella sp. PATHC035]|uniref:hypothetical protein n=1 Tax=Legionella sp. PATHC035 TaxID=2992040 RepID=UPI001A28058D|nr:hypothetical protein [Legionella sp. PATHC035]HAU0770869.1 hypothetical protein [Legionella pneumophila]MCW8409774.1 hypothetical protein [Legionella sp. PATHC035]HAU0870458.1 hypothetical protein [Legionella pneumophila]HAU0888888.1 hypothetical protein [Legionella pneumophila]HCD9491454.1 hypothetical protein [Legionella pneumophila]